MSFVTLKKAELEEVAEEFGVEIDKGATKPQIIAALNTDGVTWDMYEESKPDEEYEPPSDAAPAAVQPKKNLPTVLLKMQRSNGTYEIRGYRFTKDNPFLPVDEDSANFILENIPGFIIASPRQAKEFYS